MSQRYNHRVDGRNPSLPSTPRNNDHTVWEKKPKRKIRGIILLALAGAVLFLAFNHAMKVDKANLCDRGEMNGKVCQ